MTDILHNPFHLTASEIQSMLLVGSPCLPELEAARQDWAHWQNLPQVRTVLDETQLTLAGMAYIPQTTYTQYRQFVRTGDRPSYETPYFLKRERASAAAVHLFNGQTDLKDALQDMLWSICEETNWVIPAHENVMIDLFSAETSFQLAETLVLLGDQLDVEIRSRIHSEIERRVFDPYLRYHGLQWWYQGVNNWNGVCNSSIAAAFLLIEPDPGRLARALEIALAGLKVFLEKGFEADGSSTEGVSYWQYGLMNFIALAEMLRARTGGAIDLLASEQMRKIAAYPAQMLIAPGKFASFSDCPEEIWFNTGILARLAERTGEISLLQLIAPAPKEENSSGLPMLMRNMLWLSKQAAEPIKLKDVCLPHGNLIRLTGQTPRQVPVTLVIKAGHNDENHNHNDVGSVMLNMGGESLIVDPGAGLYSRQYFSPQRYDNIFASSYGHSVPRIGGVLQEAGRQFSGKILEVDFEGKDKKVELELARAYPIDQLESLLRILVMEENGQVVLEDRFRFTERPLEIEEVLLTWHDVALDVSTALIKGMHSTLQLRIETPGGLQWRVEHLEEQCRENAKLGVLKRLTALLPAQVEGQVRIRMSVLFESHT